MILFGFRRIGELNYNDDAVVLCIGAEVARWGGTCHVRATVLNIEMESIGRVSTENILKRRGGLRFVRIKFVLM